MSIKLKLFEINEYWLMGESMEDCIKEFTENYGELGDCSCREVTDEELDRLIFTCTDENERIIGERTFREQMEVEEASEGTFPRLFAVERY